jgi:hypothetical protein
VVGPSSLNARGVEACSSIWLGVASVAAIFNSHWRDFLKFVIAVRGKKGGLRDGFVWFGLCICWRREKGEVKDLREVIRGFSTVYSWTPTISAMTMPIISRFFDPVNIMEFVDWLEVCVCSRYNQRSSRCGWLGKVRGTLLPEEA